MSTAIATTPTFTLTFTDENLDLTDAAHVYVTFKSGTTKVTKSDSQLTIAEKSVSAVLTQADTLSFLTASSNNVTPVEIQVNWTYSGGDRGSSEVVTYPFSKQLLAEVVS